MTKRQQAQAAQAEYLTQQKLLNSDIQKASFRPFYLFFGEEPYLRSQNRDKMRKALADGTGDMNLLSVKGKDIDPQELIGFAETVPKLEIRLEDMGRRIQKLEQKAG